MASSEKNFLNPSLQNLDKILWSKLNQNRTDSVDITAYDAHTYT